MSIIVDLANIAREALANEIMEHSSAKNLNAENVTEWINKNVGNLNTDASAIVNAWEHSYISGLLYEKTNSANLAYIAGYTKEFGIGSITNSPDALKDLYNNMSGIEIAKNSSNIGQFGDNLFGGIFEPDFHSGSGLRVKDITEPILDLNNDDRMNDPNTKSKMLKSFVSSYCVPNVLSNIIQKFKDSFISGIYAIDPLILDLDGNGIETTQLSDGMMMDHDKDGFKELSAWVGGNDGILAYDKNNNGRIDNGNELFGDYYEKSDGTKASSGFDALSDLDTNNDGVIDSSDTNFADLQLIKADGSIITIEEAGIKSINLSSQSKYEVDLSGNQLLNLGSYTTEDGASRKIGDYSLQVNKTISIANEEIPIPEEIAKLPFVSGYGVVHNLHQAMVLDESKELKNLVESFVAQTDIGEKKKILTQILYKWTGADSVEDGSRGENFDAKNLYVLEQFLNSNFIGKEGTPNPNPQAANLLLSTFTDLSLYVYSQLETQTALKPLYDKIKFDVDDLTGSMTLNLSEVQSYISNVITSDELNGQLLLTDFCQTFITLGYKDQSNYSEFYKYFAEYGEDYVMLLDSADKLVRYGTNEADNIEGTAEQEAVFAQGGNDTIHTRQGDDIVYGGDGDDYIDTCENNDKIYGGNGNDTIITGFGNDTAFGGEGNDYIENNSGSDYINGGAGDDTIKASGTGDTIIGGLGNDSIEGSAWSEVYEFNLGDGNDTILERAGDDVIRFGEGITTENIIFTGMDKDADLLITFKNTDDSLLIKYVASEEQRRIEKYEFSDGTILTWDDIVSRVVTNGTDGSDTLTDSLLSEKLYGYAGNDLITVKYGNDTVFGGDGNDTLISEGPDNILSGGRGNDYLQGAVWNETYVFNLKDGNDTIYDENGTDTLKFGEGITLENTVYSTEGAHIKITFKNSEDTILLKEAANSDERRIERYEFSDGTVYTNEEMLKNLRNYGTSSDDTLTGSILSEKIYGYAGNDSIVSGDGDDTVYGGAGDDYIENSRSSDVLYGESGNDTISVQSWNNTIIGGLGDDSINSRDSSDTYIFNLGDGNDTIQDYRGTDTLQFGEGITLENIIFTGLKNENNNDFLITFKNSTDSIFIKYGSNIGDYEIDRYVFSDGTELTVNEVKQLAVTSGTNGNDTLLGSVLSEKILGFEGNDSILSYEGDDTVYGGAGDDYIINRYGNDLLYGEAGNDTIINDLGESTMIGGFGNDYIQSGVWNDTYVFNLGDGNDTIYDRNGSDILKFGDGITLDNIVFTGCAQDNDLLITFKGSTDSILIKYSADSGDTRIEKYVFADGSELTFDEAKNRAVINGTDNNDTIKGSLISEKIYGFAGDDSIVSYGNDTIYGGDGNDTLISEGPDNILSGGRGNDYLQGTVLNETYVFNLKDGNDTIYDKNGTDTMQFGEGITLENTVYSTEGAHIKITFKNSEDTILLKEAANSDERRIERYEFSDGTVYTNEEMLKNLRNYGTSSDDTLTGSILSEKIYGYAGNDSIVSGDGDDTVYGGAGDDYMENFNGCDLIFGGEGNDTIINVMGEGTMIGGLGNDSMIGSYRNDSFVFNLHDGDDTLEAHNGQDTIYFETTINKNDIAIFIDKHNNLFIDYGIESGTDKIKAIGNSVENVSAGGYTLTDSAINKLIQDMSTYATQQGISISSVEDVKANADLMNMVNSAWIEAA